MSDEDVRGWANELWRRRDALPPELWRDIARVGRHSDAAGTANLGRWIAGPALLHFTAPEHTELGARTWPAFHQHFVVEFAKLVRENGAVTEFKNRSAPGKKSSQPRQFIDEWNHRIRTGEFHRGDEDKRIPRFGKQVDTIFRSHFGETFR